MSGRKGREVKIEEEVGNSRKIGKRRGRGGGAEESGEEDGHGRSRRRGGQRGVEVVKW